MTTRASRELFHIAPELILIPEERQRKMELSIDDLIPSVRARGILLPLLLRELEGNFELIAGWRRLQTALFLKLSEVPYRLVTGDVSLREVQIIELEENARRKDLSWQDNCSAVWKIHNFYLEDNKDWSSEQTAQILGYDRNWLNRLLDLGEAIASGDQSVIKAETQANATTLLSRRRARNLDETINRVLSDASPSASSEDELDGHLPADGGSAFANASAAAGAVQPRAAQTVQAGGSPDLRGDNLPNTPRREQLPYAILHTEAGEYLAGYAGKKFNFLHADLPYGVALNGQANQEAFEGGGYESSPEIYWALTDMLIANWDKFMYPNAHIMWWFAFKFYEETIARFEKGLAHLDVRINPTPLIWHKTDNRGILADPMRGPRNIGEYALLISTGDRKIVKPVANLYGAPTAKGDSIHTNEKSEPMLRHFFSMLVDGHSRVLDPTAGSGSAIRVAESLGAESAIGLEHNPEFAARAQAKLVSARNLRNLAEKVPAKSTLDSAGEQ